mmetsp:Transcript_1935/g.6173  ORF Transcript_1935/g.6173 Transcript_1935/m.6173 type:complete len:325 (-) Transcript_1935:2444-3418(-)
MLVHVANSATRTCSGSRSSAVKTEPPMAMRAAKMARAKDTRGISERSESPRRECTCESADAATSVQRASAWRRDRGCDATAGVPASPPAGDISSLPPALPSVSSSLPSGTTDCIESRWEPMVPAVRADATRSLAAASALSGPPESPAAPPSPPTSPDAAEPGVILPLPPPLRGGAGKRPHMAAPTFTSTCFKLSPMALMAPAATPSTLSANTMQKPRPAAVAGTKSPSPTVVATLAQKYSDSSGVHSSSAQKTAVPTTRTTTASDAVSRASAPDDRRRLRHFCQTTVAATSHRRAMVSRTNAVMGTPTKMKMMTATRDRCVCGA